MIKPSYVIAKRFVQKGELKMQLSDRVQKMQGSPIRKFNPIAIAAEEKGKKIGVYTVEEDEWLDMGQMPELEKMRIRLYGE